MALVLRSSPAKSETVYLYPMHIREATEADIPAIVALLKISLGESLMPKSEAFWRWKHIDNPFGQSPVLLAFEHDLLIGVRAFMRWEWKQGDKIYKAVRAVDTATHPQHQGKGIFKELTGQLVEQCRAEGVHFIFNTPNKQSMPGYLKMGWQKQGRMRIHFSPVWFPSGDANSASFRYPGEISIYARPESVSNVIQTKSSSKFLNWRYAQNPNMEYYQFQGEGERGLFRIKKTARMKEMRITELFWSGQNPGDIRSMITHTARSFGAHVITWSGFQLPIPSVILSVGPTITINPLNPDNSLSFDRWKPTLGDMEVF